MRKDRNVLSLFSLLEKYIKKFFSKMIIMKRYNSIHLLIFFRNIRGCARNEKIISDLFFNKIVRISDSLTNVSIHHTN